MKIRSKIFFLHGVLFFLFALGLVYLRFVEMGRLEIIKKQETLDRKQAFARILQMVTSNVKSFTRDYSNWDDMAAFALSGDKEWAKSNIEGSLTNFDLDALWIYNLSGQLIYFDVVPELQDVSNGPPLNSDLSVLFKGSVSLHFFVEIENRIIEIYGETINMIADPQRKDPKGYLLSARSWDKEHLESLEVLTGTKIAMPDFDSALAVRPDPNRLGELNFEYPLNGVDGSAIRTLSVSSPSNMMSKAILLSRNFVLMVLVFLLVVFFFVTFALIFWINRPLKSITSALDKEDFLPIDDLASKNNEMGDIARLVMEFFRQKNKLFTEKQEREFTQKNLQKAYEELKTMQNQLFQREKMASVGQLAAGVAHEINNPVGFIGNNMEVLREYVGNYARILSVVSTIKEHANNGDLEKVKETVNELKRLEVEVDLDFISNDIGNLLEQSSRGLDRIRKIVFDLKTFSRADSTESKELVKLQEVMDGILSIVQNELKYKAELIKEYGDTPAVRCNPQRIGQVFINLLVNAAQAMEERGKITIKTYQQDKYVCVDIIDTGKGIPEENLKKIFDPFFTTKPVGEGTGLGLSVSYEIVKKNGGEIKVRSKVGEGTVFTVMFPTV